MRVAIFSGGTGWHVQDLQRAATAAGHSAQIYDFRTINSNLLQEQIDVAIVRTMPAGSLEQVVFRMDLLHGLQQRGVRVLNSPYSLETCVDKFMTDLRLNKFGIKTPKTIVCQGSDDAMEAFEQLGHDVVVKPIFGAEGRGMTRVTDKETAWRIFRSLEQVSSVLYLQQFINHHGWDLRVFMTGCYALAAMKRSSNTDWRTNIAQGAVGIAHMLTDAQLALARTAVQAVGAEIAGVDLIQGRDREWYVLEVNAVPGWRALGKVCQIDVAAEIIRYSTTR